MENKKYIIKYSDAYIKQFNSILKYMAQKLNNKVAAQNFYENVVRKIEKRTYKPDSYEHYISNKERKNKYYRIYVKNYTIFYTLKDNVMEVRRILSNRRNFSKFI